MHGNDPWKLIIRRRREGLSSDTSENELRSDAVLSEDSESEPVYTNKNLGYRKTPKAPGPEIKTSNRQETRPLDLETSNSNAQRVNAASVKSKLNLLCDHQV